MIKYISFALLLGMFLLFQTKDYQLIKHSKSFLPYPADTLNQNYWNNKLFSIEDLQKDFLQLRSVCENEHCALYEYTRKEKFDNLFDRQFSLINHPMQYHEFFQILAPINNHIGCMHSSIWMPGDFWDVGKENLFPLHIKLIDGYAVVAGYYNETSQVPVGSIILEINSLPIKKIISDDNLKHKASIEDILNL